MKASLTTVQKGTVVAEDLVTAEINVSAAQTALDNYLAVAGNAAMNTVLVNIASALDVQKVA